jgi:hypothetical protein
VAEAEFSAGAADAGGAGLLDEALALLFDPQPPSKAAAPVTAVQTSSWEARMVFSDHISRA